MAIDAMGRDGHLIEARTEMWDKKTTFATSQMALLV